MVVCTLFLAANLSSIGYDIHARQTCGFEDTHVLCGVGNAIYVFVGLGASACDKSLEYAQHLFTDNLAPWSAIMTTFKCGPHIRIGIIAAAVLLAWMIYGEAVAVMTGGEVH